MTPTASALYANYVSTHFGALHRATPDELESYARHYRGAYTPHLPADKAAKILDIGCGLGHFLYFLKQAGYTNYLGIDIGREQVALCREHVTPNVEQVAETTTYLRARPTEFDAIVCIDVLEHLGDEELLELCDAVRGALKPNGRFIVSVPNAACLTTLMTRYSDLTHRRLFSEVSLRQLFLTAGFTDILLLPLEKRVVRSHRNRLEYWLWRLRDRLARWLLHEAYTHLMEGAIPTILTVNILGVATNR